jgi:transglutaminase-like putative cysteine protease
MKYSGNISSSNNSIRYRIRHVTRFTYEQPAYESHNEVRLRPRESPSQRTLGFRLETIPPAAVIDYIDAFGNAVHALSVHEPHCEFMVLADSLVERTPLRELPIDRSFEDFLSGDAMRSQEEYDFLHPSRYIPFSEELKKFFWMIRPRMNEPVVDYTRRLVAWVCDQFAYEPGSTNVHSDVNRVLSVGAGVCQDFAHLTIGVLRLAGVPARYVSGYLAPQVDHGRALGEQASHAWVEAMLPEAGWSGFDPTHGSRVTDHHVRLAVGRDYADVPPIRGVYRSAGKQQTMQVSLAITQLEPGEETPFDHGATQQ